MVCTKSKSVLQSRWPRLFNAIEGGILSYVDYAFAELLLREFPNADESSAAFLCHLFLSSRSGHMCTEVCEDQITPSPFDLWKQNTAEALPDDLTDLLSSIAGAARSLPDKIAGDVSMSITFPSFPICRNGNLFYLQKNWVHETLFLSHFQRLLTEKPEIIPDEENVKVDLEDLLQKKLLTHEQAEAIAKAIGNCLTVITGGPGTGKTYTAANFIKLFWSILTPEVRETCKIALAAPTGKAALNLYNSLQKAMDGSDILEKVQPKTLHTLLGIKNSTPLKREDDKKISADLILVDEASMIDARIWSVLLSSIKPGARLILLGDPNQLPSVEAGAVFSDMISALKGFSGNMANLTKVLRAELFSLVEFAEAINAQKTEKALSFLNQGTGPVKRVSFKSSSARIFFDELAAFGFPLFPNMCLNTHSPLEIIESFNRFRILSPLRKGWMGVDEINRFFACKTLSLSKEDEVAIPITISANDYRMNLFNGESGVLIRKKCQNEEFLQVHKEDYALFLDASSVDGFRKIPANLLPKHEYGYCLSVHKSQGSEFDKVLLLMPKGSEIFGKGVVYTAVTRAKKEIAVWEEDGIFGNALETLSKRQSGICARFSLMIFGKGDC